MKRIFLLNLVLILSLVFPNCATDPSYSVVYVNHQASEMDWKFSQTRPALRQSHTRTLSRLRSMQNKPKGISRPATNIMHYTTSTTDSNPIIARPNIKSYEELMPQDKTRIARPPMNDAPDLDRSENINSILGLQIMEYSRALQTMSEGYKSYQVVKVKVFPIEKINNRIYEPYPWVPRQHLRNVTLENYNGFDVSEMDMSTGDIVKEFGNFQKVDLTFGQPADQLSGTNVATLTNKSGNSTTVSLNTLADGSGANNTNKYKSRSLIITPTTRPNEEGIDFDGTEEEDEVYLQAGFTNVKWQGSFNRNGSDVQEHSYFYRGDFEVAYAHRYRTNPRYRIWSIINLVDMEDYVTSVSSKELAKSAVDRDGYDQARSAQVIATRTYTVGIAEVARTGRIPRLWDVLPTTANQAYLGVKAEISHFRQAVIDTRHDILATKNTDGDTRLVASEYFGCTNERTLYPPTCRQSNPTVCAPELTSRMVPETVNCRYSRSQMRVKKDMLGRVRAYGHGRGMCQECAIHLATRGWDDNTKRPTEEATYPSNYTAPWNHRDILQYFYNESNIYKLTDALD